MLRGWFKCPVAAWQIVRRVLPKPWSYDCMVADVRWWNDQTRMGWQSSQPSREELSEHWGVGVEVVDEICVEVSTEAHRKPPKQGQAPSHAPASRGLSDQTPDQTSYTKSDSESSESRAPEGYAESQAKLEALWKQLTKSGTSKD